MTAKVKTFVCCLIIAICFAPNQVSQAQLVANFTGTPVSGCAPLVVQFNDQSTGNPTQWRWDLGNGTISFLQNPAVTYFNPGQYNVKLVVRNANGADSVVKNQYISVFAQPTVAFTGTPTTGCYPLLVQFADQSAPGSGTIASWEWDFGDGTGANVQNPSHTYTSSGNYNVTLRVTNSNGCVRTLSRPQYIQISNGVTANFSNSAPNSCNPPATINFQNLTVGTGAIAYEWNFGDGGTSTLPNPTHVYAAMGSYTVTLIAINSTGCRDTIVKPNAITIGSVTGAFTGPDSVCVGAVAAFVNTSTPAPGGATWDFGDGTGATGINAAKVYAAAGTYTVKMIANFGACTDSATKTITVLAKPTAAFTAPAPSSCNVPHTVAFTNTSSGAVSYQWNFGDGGSSNLANPSHTYGAFGSYDVTLIATNAFGCSDTLVQTAFVNLQPTDVQINNLPSNGCAPLTRSFAATVTSLDPVVSYLWDFGDGNTATGANPTHTYTAAGSYTVSLIVVTANGCRDTVTVANGISVGTRPTANFSATPRDACAKQPVSFTDLSTGSITQWLWVFGDGGTSSDQNPIHEYQDTGYFDVQLIIWNNGCPDSITFTNYVYIKPPIARFMDTFNCANPWQRTFIDQSIGADQWTWNFGDGGTSTLQNPVHTYADTGTYTVTLTVVNLATGCDYVTTRVIKVMDERANFFASDTVVCRGNTLTFNSVGNVPANVAEYTWNFGDGSATVSGGSVVGATVTHLYTLAGNYNVQLIVKDNAGCFDTLVKPLYIRVDGPTAGFAPTVPGSCLNSAVTFADSSASDGLHPIQQWVWNYGDGNTATLTAPPFQHTYATAGVYTVSLLVVDSKGCRDSITQNSSLVISRPQANFDSPDTLSCPNRPINFVSQSTGPGLTYQWNFGDGNTATGPNPVHNYVADGTYTVKLVITDQYGCVDSISKPAYVTIITPIANFTMSDSVSTCPPMLVQFTNTSTISNTISWDFGDGTAAQVANPSHFYNSPGNYTVRLTVTGPGGCTDTRQKLIVVRGPQGSFSYGPLTGCAPLAINVTATTIDRLSFIWDFNDGTTISTADSVLQHVYTNPGVYLPKMILVDSAGCQVPITGLDTIRVNGVQADFTQDAFTVCDAGSISFTNASQSNDVITGYVWDFGDGASSTATNPTHFYAAPGLYFPRLIVTTLTGCIDTITLPAPLKIVSSPQAQITASPNGCAPLTATFLAGLEVTDTSAMNWDWNFGNGGLSALQNPAPQLYSIAGSYSVQLIATNSSGCKDTVTRSIEAYLVPTVSAGLDTMICEGRGITLSATGANSYNWTPALGLSCANCANPVATPDSVTNYIVVGSTPQGCSNRDTVRVWVKYPFNMTASPGDTLCRGGSVRLYAQGAHSYAWSPATGLNNAAIANPLAVPLATTLYRVVGTDDRGCFTDTAFVPVQVYPIPTVEAGNDLTINVGQTADLMPVLSPDVTNVTWTPTAGIFRTNYPGITVKPQETTEYTVEVSNPGGCRARDKVTVFVICNGANVFIPNTFSPNGDGANDIFYPRGSGLFSIKTLRIFNRWGEVVFEKNNFNPNDASAGWNGTYKGVKLNPDVYVYMADIVCDNSTTLVLKGNVALIQ
jgi:gliding motility-associated-like protein